MINGTRSQTTQKHWLQTSARVGDKPVMPRIVMGENKTETIRKFKHDQLSETKAILIDLDNSEDHRDNDLGQCTLTNSKDLTFYMIQEMEAWFLSQPKILDAYWKERISNKLPKRHAKTISDPSDELIGITRNSRKGRYDKVRDGANLLMHLDPKKLEDEFDDFKRLIEYCGKIDCR